MNVSKRAPRWLHRAQRFLPRYEEHRVLIPCAEPVGAATAAAIDTNNALPLAGRTGAIRASDQGSPSVSWRGELGPLQNFRGGLIGSSRNIFTGLNQVLPGTTAPPNPATDRLLALLASMQAQPR